MQGAKSAEKILAGKNNHKTILSLSGRKAKLRPSWITYRQN